MTVKNLSPTIPINQLVFGLHQLSSRIWNLTQIRQTLPGKSKSLSQTANLRIWDKPLNPNFARVNFKFPTYALLVLKREWAIPSPIRKLGYAWEKIGDDGEAWNLIYVQSSFTVQRRYVYQNIWRCSKEGAEEHVKWLRKVFFSSIFSLYVIFKLPLKKYVMMQSSAIGVARESGVRPLYTSIFSAQTIYPGRMV